MERVDRGSEPAHYCSGRNTMHPRTDRFFDASNACISGLFGAKPSVIPFEPGLERVATRFIGSLRAIKRRNSVGGEAWNWHASALPIRKTEEVGRA